MRFRAFFSSLLAGASATVSWTADLTPALDSISTTDFAQRTRILSSDAFEGRAPASAGEERTLRYLVQTFREFGLQPGGPDGSWYQEVPLVGIHSQPRLSLTHDGTTEEWKSPADYVAWSPWARDQVHVGPSDLVFVGYGVVAPEYAWDDFKDVDVRGRTLVMLVNDPPVPRADDPDSLDPAVFRGRAMTYYGRWTYKFEIAAERGAAAALLVHETGPAGYPFSVVINSWGRENFDLQSTNGNTNRLPVAAWITVERARKLFALTGHDFDDLKQQAVRRDFRPVPLTATFQAEVTNTVREVRSRNVLARLTGSDPVLRDECIVYSAHWDHLGRDPDLKGDQIFNGALDNASGTAALLEIAEAFGRLPRPPKRTVLFLSVTAEEQGLLGSRYYARHPIVPLSRTLADFNMDGVNVVGRQQDIGVIGHGLNTLEDLLVRAAASQHRTVREEAEPEKGGYSRSDHFEFARLGVPALYLDVLSDDIIGHPPGYGRQRREEYRTSRYHKVTDEMQPWWDFSGAVDDARLLVLVGWEVAETRHWPEWKPGAEFKALREAMLKTGPE